MLNWRQKHQKYKGRVVFRGDIVKDNSGWARDRLYSSCLGILWTKITRILMWSTWVFRFMHNTCTEHGRSIKTQSIGSTSILPLRKDWNSVRLDRMRSSFKKHFQLIVFRKLLEWKLEKSFTKKYTCHLGFRQRSPWNTSGKENWGSEHAQRSEVGQLSGSFQSNQPTLNPVRERTRRPVIRDDARTVQDGRKTFRSPGEEPVSSERTERPVHQTNVIQTRSSEDSKDPNVEQAHERKRRLVNVTNTEDVPDCSHVLFMKAQRSTLEMKHFVRERGESVIDHDNLSHEKIMVNEADMTSEFQGHILLWSMRRVPAFEHWFRKLRTTQIDMLFNKIYDRINRLILSVKNPNKWFMKLETSNYVNCSKRNPKRSAQHAYHIGT